MTDIYLTISLSTHNGDNTPQNHFRIFGLNWECGTEVEFKQYDALVWTAFVWVRIACSRLLFWTAQFI